MARVWTRIQGKKLRRDEIDDAIRVLITKNKTQISQAKTARDVISANNYNCTVGVPFSVSRRKSIR